MRVIVIINITKIKKNGKLLSDLIAPENDEDNFYHRILTITKKGILGDKKEEVQLLKDSTNIYITKNNYEHDYFPFWRLLDPEQYVRTKYGEYPEYHTSLDNFNVVTLKGVMGGYKVAKEAIKLLLKNHGLLLLIEAKK